MYHQREVCFKKEKADIFLESTYFDTGCGTLKDFILGDVLEPSVPNGIWSVINFSTGRSPPVVK